MQHVTGIGFMTVLKTRTARIELSPRSALNTRITGKRNFSMTPQMPAMSVRNVFHDDFTGIQLFFCLDRHQQSVPQQRAASATMRHRWAAAASNECDFILQVIDYGY
jgi:hypothetical protein